MLVCRSKWNKEVDIQIKEEFERAEMRVSRIVANEAKIPLQAATRAALALRHGSVAQSTEISNTHPSL